MTNATQKSSSWLTETWLAYAMKIYMKNYTIILWRSDASFAFPHKSKYNGLRIPFLAERTWILLNGIPGSDNAL